MAVAGFNVAPVKSLGLQHPEEIQLEETGVRENRRFFLIREDGSTLPWRLSRSARADPARVRRGVRAAHASLSGRLGR